MKSVLGVLLIPLFVVHLVAGHPVHAPVDARSDGPVYYYPVAEMLLKMTVQEVRLDPKIYYVIPDMNPVRK